MTEIKLQHKASLVSHIDQVAIPTYLLVSGFSVGSDVCNDIKVLV